MDEIYNAFADPKSEHIHLENHPNVLFNKDYNDDYSISAVKDECIAAITEYINNSTVGEKITQQSVTNYLQNKVAGLNEALFDTYCTLPNIQANEIPTLGTIVVDEA